MFTLIGVIGIISVIVVIGKQKEFVYSKTNSFFLELYKKWIFKACEAQETAVYSA